MNDAQALRSTAFTTVDLDKPGKQIGFVMIPHSPHGDAWGVTRLPIGVIANGTGPTVIIEGGNHGDEYEGPITICELIRDLDPGEVQGRLILMPANNAHGGDCRAADLAGRRAQSQPHVPRRSRRHDHAADLRLHGAGDFSAGERLPRPPLGWLFARHRAERRSSSRPTIPSFAAATLPPCGPSVRR